MEWIDQTELVCSVWYFLHDLLYTTWSALSTCLSISNIHHYSILLPIHLFFILLFSLHHTDTNIVSLICQCLSGQKKMQSRFVRSRNQVWQLLPYSCSTTHSELVPAGDTTESELTFLQIRLNITILTSCHLLHCSIRLRRALTTKDELPFKLQL